MIYVARDIERTLGRKPDPDYLIVTNRTPFSEEIEKVYPDFVFLLDNKQGPQDTLELLKSNIVEKLIKSKDHSILVFKNTPQIEAYTAERSWKLLNPPATLAEKIENKISQTEWLGQIGQKYLPPHRTLKVSEVSLAKIKDSEDFVPIVLQWAHSHSGDGTILVTTKKDLVDIQKKFPDRLARVTDYINGPSFTVNIVSSKDKVLVGNMSYQITGLPPFTDNQFTTVGNDWSATHSLLSEPELNDTDKLIQDVSKQMQSEGWIGLFGLDIMRDDESNQIYLIEINARQPASTAYESFLQEINRRNGVPGVTTFEAHLDALQGRPLKDALILVNDGAQIIQRITKNITGVDESTIGSLELAGYNVIDYPNTEYNTDLIRIQSDRGIIETHNKLNARGKEIVDIISNAKS